MQLNQNNNTNFFVTGLILFSVSILIFIVFFFHIQKITSSIPIKSTTRILLEQKNLLFLTKKSVKTILQKSDPTLNLKSIQKKYPHSLYIAATKIKPIAVINGATAVSKKGIIINSNIKKKSLTQISFFQTIPSYMKKKGSKIQFKDIVYSLNLINYAQNNSIILRIQSITIPKQKILKLKLKNDDIIYILTTEKPIDKNIFFMHNIRKVLTQQKVNAKIVDLRFDTPVIKQ